jgi:SNF2 family DNA or RNA helicase
MKKLADIITPLQPHQKRVVDRLQEQRGLVVAHGLGSGKTLSSIAAAESLGLPTSIVVPASLQANYLKEIDKHTNPGLKNFKLDSLQKITRNADQNYTTGLLVVDEAHRLRDPKTKGYKAIKKTVADKKLLLTASPVYNHPVDVSSLVNIAAGEKVLPEDKKDFEAKYIKREAIKPSLWGRLVHRAKPGEREVLTNTRELSGVLKQWVDYHENTANKEYFPERKDEFIRVPMSAKQQVVYDALLDKAPAWVKYKVKKGLPPNKQEKQLINSFLTTQRQVSGNIRPYVEGLSPEEAVEHAVKANEAFKRFNENLKKDSSSKAVVYSNYLDAGLEPYEVLLKQNKIPFGKFTGQMKKKERDQVIKDFNDDKIKALLVSSAGGEGLDLKGTRQVQILDPHWNNEKIEQVIGRAIRFKSHDHLPEAKRNVTVERYLATTRPGLFSRILDRKSSDMSADEYLDMLSKNKDELNNALRGLLQKQGAFDARRDLGLSA